jgi:hypothetical protein
LQRCKSLIHVSGGQSSPSVSVVSLQQDSHAFHLSHRYRAGLLTFRAHFANFSAHH